MVVAGILVFFYILGVAACANMIGVWHGISYAQLRDVERAMGDGISACFLSLIWPVSLMAIIVVTLACSRGYSKPVPRIRPAARDVPSRPPVIREGEDGQWFLNEEESLL